MNKLETLAAIRRDYGKSAFDEHTIDPDPIAQFKIWFEETLKNEQYDPTAMVLSTVDPEGWPDSRVVLLKGLEKDKFLFYTNYESTKALQIQKNPKVALNFYWPTMSRQVRIRGVVKKINKEQSDEYFSSRPINSQYSAIISPQSREIPDRTFLEQAFKDLVQDNEPAQIMRPEYWGGYMVIPHEIEFWQGRDDRLHDRIHYYQNEGQWQYHRLAP